MGLYDFFKVDMLGKLHMGSTNYLKFYVVYTTQGIYMRLDWIGLYGFYCLKLKFEKFCFKFWFQF